MKKFLDANGFANKNEFVTVTKQHILNEAKLDDLDDQIYKMTQEWNLKKQKLASIREKLDELKMEDL
ncbi:hypothetical protein NDK43_20435 [Neobacillus pocheonensis]|uniref:Uncharacterized protein n=1 Tax=Neobacillus pocheonensis TaxID=363869 RepID=A0ABT0WD86_9BACI|nr:hypothetical protein [Neobacillus pocheonensis]